MVDNKLQTDSVLSLLNDISEYGIGYSDALSNVAIPLIVALFAFGFPLLFTILTHINSKYESEEISRLFEGLSSYKSFLRTSKLCVAYLLLFAVATLLTSGNIHRFVLLCFDYSSVIVAAVYAYCILSFADTCIKMNNPAKLLQIIIDSYPDELKRRYISIWKRIFWSIERTCFRTRNDKWKKFVIQRERYKQVSVRHYVNELYIKRLLDLAKYIMKTSDGVRLRSVLAEVNRFSDSEETKNKESADLPKIRTAKSKFFTNKFYSSLISYYPSCPQNKEIENVILSYLYNNIDRSQYPDIYDLVSITQAIITISETDRTSLVESYIDQLQYKYGFIRRMPLNVYYVGGSVYDIKHTETEAYNVWLEHSEIFFLMCAILFSKGEYNFIKNLPRGYDFPQGMLHPVIPSEILKLYIQCRKKLQGNSGFWNSENYFGNKINESVLDRYVAALLLIFDTPQRNTLTPININDLQSLCTQRKRLCQYEDDLKNDNPLVMLYPVIRQRNVACVFNESLESLRCQRNIQFIDKNTQRKSFVSRLFYNIQTVLFSNNSIFNTHKTNVLNYNAPISRAEEDECTHLVSVTDDFIARKLGEAFIKQGSVTNLHQLSVDKYTFIKSRSLDMSFDNVSAHLLALKRMIIWNRVLFLLLKACITMNIKSYKVAYPDINDFLMSHTNGNVKDYVILDVESPFFVDSIGAEKKNYLACIPNYRLEIQSSDYLSKTVLYKLFENCLLLIPKDSMPVYKRVNHSIHDRLTIENESSEPNGVRAMRVTIDPDIILAFNPNTNIIKIELKEARII